DVICLINVQHNCAAEKYDTSAHVRIRYERDLSTQTRPAVRHYMPTNLLLNTAQMRSA
ncbi:hypothetical protein OF83DRAFT_1046293, partial [Amylostereum chailletii]